MLKPKNEKELMHIYEILGKDHAGVVLFDGMMSNDTISYDKLAEVIDYLRHERRKESYMQDYQMSIALWKSGQNAFDIALNAICDEIDSKKRNIILKFGGIESFREFVHKLQFQVDYLLKEIEKEEEE